MASESPDNFFTVNSGLSSILSLLFSSIFLFACASGGSSSEAPIIIPPTTVTETDQRIPFTTFSNAMLSPWGDITVEYAVGDFSPSSQWPSNDKYRIEDYGFLRVTSFGTHPGDYASPDEPSDPGPYLTNGQWFEANLNNDEHTDLIYIGNNCCNRDFVLEDIMLTFVNDGNGHFELNSNIFAENIFPCVQGGRSWLADEFDPLHPCGNQQDYTNGKIVADFNGDGISDYYDTSILYLSNSEGKLENKSFSNLPELFFLEGHGQIFVHDANYASAIYRASLFGIDSEFEFGARQGKSKQPFSLTTTDSINLASLQSINNDYFAVSLFKGPYFLNFSSNSNFGNQAVIGLQFSF